MLENKISTEKFIEYMDKTWYDSCKDFSFYDAHNNKNKTYTGYWCWLAAAVLKIRSINNVSGKYIPTEVI